MRLKKVGKKLQLLRPVYVSEDRRTREKMIASVNVDTFKIPSAVLPLLTHEEIIQVNYLLMERHLTEKKIASKKVLETSFVESGNLAIWALTHRDIVDALNPEEVIRIWSVLEGVQCAMEKANLPRPKKEFIQGL